MSVLDADTGTVLRTIPVGVAPYEVRLDSHAHRALVLNAGGGTIAPADSWGWLPSRLRRLLPFVPQHAPTSYTAPGALTIVDTSRL